MKFIAVFFIVLLTLLLGFRAEAGDWRLIELRDMTVIGKKFFPRGRDPLITNNGLEDRELGEELDLNVNMDIGHFFYWENLIHSMTDNRIGTNSGQFRVIGLNFRWGVHLTEHVDVQYEHYSQHELDNVLPGGFPVQDSIGVRLKVYETGRALESIF